MQAGELKHRARLICLSGSLRDNQWKDLGDVWCKIEERSYGLIAVTMRYRSDLIGSNGAKLTYRDTEYRMKPLTLQADRRNGSMTFLCRRGAGNVDVELVIGCPCCGKSTYVREHREKFDVYWDFDDVFSAITGLASHERNQTILPFVYEMRDGFYRAIDNGSFVNKAWIIYSTYQKSIVDTLVQRFDASVTYLKITREEAHARCDADNRPQEWHKYIDEWFDKCDYLDGYEMQT